MADNDERILVETDYNNIVLVDPNKVISADGKTISERLVKHENLVMYANLEANLLPRTRLNVNAAGNLDARTVSIGKINFLQPAGKSFLTNQYTDDMVGGNVDNTVLKEETKVQSTKELPSYDSELLLITQINVENKFSISTVTIELEDVRGRALFEKGENSPYAAFFNYPSPMFYLTLKGYYGKALRLELIMTKFSARFNTSTGNFSVTVNFLPFKYNILSKIKMDYLYSLPFMYEKKYTISPTTDVNSQGASTTAGNSNKGDVIERASSYGRQKLHEVYTEYKNKNLIDKNFPELTLQELAAKIDVLETNLTNIFKPTDLKGITDAENFDTALATYEKEVLFYQSSSWFEKYMDTKNFLISKDGKKIYTFKKEIIEGQNNSKRKIADDELKDKIIPENNKILKEIETYGVDTGVSYDTFRLSKFTSEDIDWEKSFLQRTGKTAASNNDEFAKFKKDSEELVARATLGDFSVGNVITYWYYFDSFLKITENLRSELKTKSDAAQEKLTEQLASKIQEKEGGLGFVPLLKNFIAIVLANTEAFIRLMCDVHEKAWGRNYDSTRASVIFDTSKSIKSVDQKDSVQMSDKNLIPVYPWPQYFEQNNSENEPYILTYLGDSRVINKTKGYQYDIWPEVEFVEEFLRGRVAFGKSKPSLGTLSNEGVISNRVSINALDFPVSNIIFSNKQIIKFLYEIWERVYMYSNYGRFMKSGTEKEISDLVVETEYLNIFNSLDVDSPELITVLKDKSFNSSNFIKSLENFSITSYPLFVRDIFVTDYIRQEISNSFTINETTAFEPGFNYSLPKLEKIDTLKKYLAGNQSNTFGLVDTFPFNDFSNWYGKNMASANQTPISDWNNSSKVLFVHEKTNMISNFTQNTTPKEIRPVTSFNYNKVTQPKPTQIEIRNFYRERQNNLNTKQQPTEGNLVYIDYDGNLNFFQTTSIMNTPYFVNSLLEGVENMKNKSTIPFLSAGYLFVNSLPLATLKEKYKTDNNTDIDLNYIFTSLNKFGSIQKMPYHWVLKYGSIWYRYKTWINTGKDFLSDTWKNFDKIKNFDPISQDANKVYNLNINNTTTNIFLQSSTTVSNITVSNMNIGFYPKVINDFHYLYFGTDLFNNYSDSEIQTYLNVNSGFTITYGTPYEENFINNPTNITNVRTFSCLLNIDDTKQAIVPSFGSNIFQINYECYNDSGTKILPIYSNDSIFDGSVRTFWGLPQYGYFDNSKVTKPNTDEYLKIILNDTPNNDKQEAFSIRYSGYSKIDELFSVFNKKQLDLMADEFLNFCKPRFSYNIGNSTLQNISAGQPFTLPTDLNGIYKNFHNLILSLLQVNKTTKTQFNDINTEIQETQFNSSMSTIRALMEYDVVIKNGNPTDFDRKLFDSFSDNPPVEPYIFNGYVPGSLPQPSNTTLSLNDYYNSDPESWKELYLSVGFSTIDGIAYNKTGSTVTDFFIDMNIQFNKDNIQLLAPLIKIYATQKSKNPNYNKNQFITDITNYLNDNKKFSDLVFNSLFNQLRSKLPTISEKSRVDQTTAVESNQVKLSMYDTFKQINDVHIAGYDYTDTTFMDDVLLLDRANRNIADYIYLDPFVIKKNLPQLADAETFSVYTFLRNVITEHNFNVELMTSYVNYYYPNDVGNSTTGPTTSPTTPQDFGNILFGTFLNVDTQYSSPKIICTSVSVPSQHLAMDKDPSNRFSEDIFYIERNNNPLVEDQKDKKDFSKSNKVVAFNVDIGTRNQNIFYNFDVSQDSSKETYESLQNIDYQVASANGKKASTANYSVWDFYKTRSYSCTVRCMGNALLQPGMYFNLRYVPMFYGPYKIMTVKHSVTPGLFETTITGMRQSIYAYETISNMKEYLQLLTRQILNEIKTKTKQNLDGTGNLTKQNLSQSLTKPKGGDAKDSNNCSKLLPQEYNKFVPAQVSATTISVSDVIVKLKNYFPYTTNVGVSPSSIQNNKRRISFFLMYLFSGTENGFTSYNNNYCGLLTGTLKQNTTTGELKRFGGSLVNFIDKSYLCREIKDSGVILPYASFENDDKMFGFLKAKWDSFIINVENNEIIDCMIKNYYLLWNKNLPNSEWDSFKTTNDYQNLKTIAEQAEKLAVAADLYT